MMNYPKMMPTPKRIDNNLVAISGTIQPSDAFTRLTKLLGIVKVVMLVELLEDVIDETGYGDVKIVIAEGKVQMLKAEHSYK